VKEKVLKMRIRDLEKDEDKTQRKNLKMIRSGGKFLEEDCRIKG
jgi:hypothetical protein